MNSSRDTFRAPPLLAHTRYVLQDFLLLRAAMPVAFITVFGWNAIHTARSSATPARWADPRFLAGLHVEYIGFIAVLNVMTVFLAVIAVMTIDRTAGYYRFFFSKPVNVVRYYLHTFAVHGASLCVILVTFALAWGARMPHESLHRAAYLGAITFALIGGLGFGFGALSNADAAITPLSFIFAISAQLTLADYTGPPRWLVVLAGILPPAADFEKTRLLLMNARPFLGVPLRHVLAYGTGAWIIGLVLLRRRPLAR